MPETSLPDCRLRGETVAVGVFRCHSPKLAGLKLVTPETCRTCYCRDHAAPEPAPPPRHLLPCLYLGAATGRGVEGPAREYACHHPRHLRTTETQCRACSDYLFPLLTPQTPSDVVRAMIELPARPQPEGWWDWPNVQQAHREAATELIDRLPPYPGGSHGRGIVIVGGGKYIVSTYVTVRVLRHVGCTLPIQVWHLAGEMSERMAALLEPYGVECVDADRLVAQKPFRFLPDHWWKGWQLKPYAVVHSPFREVLLLDADSYPVRDPSFLFDWASYRELGAVFWPDAVPSGLLTGAKCSVFGVPPLDPPFESGQLLIDKRLCWREVQLTLWYNAHADFVYNILWGDKDTFNIAWQRLGRAYSMPWPSCGWDTHTILQYDPDGAVLFQHRCRDKFRLTAPSFESTPQFTSENQFNPRLAHEALCFAFREELRRLWSPP